MVQDSRFVENHRLRETAQGELNVPGEDLDVGRLLKVEISSAHEVLRQRGFTTLPGAENQHGGKLPCQLLDSCFCLARNMVLSKSRKSLLCLECCGLTQPSPARLDVPECSGSWAVLRGRLVRSGRLAPSSRGERRLRQAAALQKLATFCRIQETHPAKSCLKYGSSISIFRGRLFVFGGQRKSRSSLDNPTNCANVSRKVQRLSRQRLRRR